MTTPTTETRPAPGAAVHYEGVITIEWPARHGDQITPLQGWEINIFDALSGKPITTCEKIEVHAPANGLVVADLTMFTDSDGKPLMELERQQRPDGKWAEVVYLRDGDMNKGIATGTFPFLVAEMRVKP